MKRIVIIGGGTGSSTLLLGLRKYAVRCSVILPTADDGGSSGRLRRDHGSVPAGDIRQCLSGLASAEELAKLFSYRFEEGALAGHTVGNIILTALERRLGNIDLAIRECRKFLGVRGEVIPVTTFPTTLSAILTNGKKIVGEHNIDEPTRRRAAIRRLLVTPDHPASRQALAAIRQADLIVFGPGDLYTSILPILCVRGVAETICQSRALKVLITNLMTKHGQTDGFKASDFLLEINRYLGRCRINTVIANSQTPPKNWLKRYQSEKSQMVAADSGAITKQGAEPIVAPLASRNAYIKPRSDRLHRSFLRHDSKKTAAIIWRLSKNN